MFSESSGGLFRVTQASASWFPLVFMWLGRGRNPQHLQDSSSEGHAGPKPGDLKVSHLEPAAFCPLHLLHDLVFTHSQSPRFQNTGKPVGSSFRPALPTEGLSCQLQGILSSTPSRPVGSNIPALSLPCPLP